MRSQCDTGALVDCKWLELRPAEFNWGSASTMGIYYNTPPSGVVPDDKYLRSRWTKCSYRRRVQRTLAITRSSHTPPENSNESNSRHVETGNPVSSPHKVI